MDQIAQEAVGKVNSCCDGLSCFELPNKGLGTRKMLLGSVVLKMKVGQGK